MQQPSPRPDDATLAMLSLLLRGDVEGVRMRGGPDWTACANLAVRHGLGPLLHERAARFAAEWPLPPKVEQGLRSAFMIGTIDSRTHLADAASAIGRLAAAGVRVAALKGLHLAAAVYEKPAFRWMNDLDLLVPEDQLETARTVLREDGYAPEGAEDPTLHHAARLAKPRATPIELHRELCPTPHPFRIRMEPLWARMTRISVGGQPALGLRAEDLALHLCVHAAFNHHCLVPLRNIYDIALVVQRPDFDWGLLEETARETGTGRAVFCGLSLAREMLGAEVPPELLERMAPGSEGRAMVQLGWDNVMSYASAGPGWVGVAMGGERPSQSVRGLLGRVFAPPSRLLETSGRRVHPLRLAWIYLTRPVVLLIRHRRFVAALLLGRQGAREQLRVGRAGASLEAWIAGGE
jgi:hypothetical protein